MTKPLNATFSGLAYFTKLGTLTDPSGGASILVSALPDGTAMASTLSHVSTGIYRVDVAANVATVAGIPVVSVTNTDSTMDYPTYEPTMVEIGTNDTTSIWANGTRTLTALGFTVTLAASQPNYAPAKAGDKMDLIDAPNATAISAFVTSIIAITTSSITSAGTLFKRLLDFVGASGSYTAPTSPLDATATQNAVTAGLTAQGYTTTRAPKLDHLNADVSSFGDPWSTTGLSGYPTGSAGYDLSVILSKANLIGIAGTTITTPTDGKLTIIYKNRDYNALDGLSLDYLVNIVLDPLDTIHWNGVITTVTNPTTVTATGTYLDSNHVRINLTASASNTFQIGESGVWEVVVTRHTGGRIIQAATGKLTVRPVVA